MKKTNFYIIGTAHQDPDGPQRLESLLQRVRPEIIALETSEGRIGKSDSKRRPKKKLKEEIESAKNRFNLTPDQAVTLVGLIEFYSQIHGYEIRVTQQYVTQYSDVKLAYIDTTVDSHVSDEYTNLLTRIYKTKYDATSGDKFKKILDRGQERFLQKMRGQCERLYQETREEKEEFFRIARDPRLLRKLKGIWPEAHRVMEGLIGEEREKIMAKNIRALYSEEKRMIAICGMGHLYSLCYLLADLRPSAVPLNEYHKI